MAEFLLTSFGEIVIDANLNKHINIHNGSSANMSMLIEASTSHSDVPIVTTAPPDGTEVGHNIKPLIPKSMMIYIDIYSHIVVPFIVSSFGVVSNVINLIIFTRLGLRDGMSVGLWCLSFSDLTVTGQTLGSSICSLCGLTLPRDTPISPGLVHYVSLLWSQDMMYLVSNWITTFISLERCCCVIWPFRVKSLFTRTRSVIVIIMIFVVHIASYAPIFASHRLEFVQVSTSWQDTSLLSGDGNRHYDSLANSTFPTKPNTPSSSPFEDLLAEIENDGNGSTSAVVSQNSQSDNLRQHQTFPWFPTQPTSPAFDNHGHTFFSYTIDTTASVKPYIKQDLPLHQNLDLNPGSAKAERDTGSGEGLHVSPSQNVELGHTSLSMVTNTPSPIKPGMVKDLDLDSESIAEVEGGSNSEKILKVTFSKNRAVIHHTVDIINGAVLPVIQQALVIASAGGLAYGLKATSKVRVVGHAQRSDSTAGKAGGGNDGNDTKQTPKTSSLSQKEVRLVKVVAFLALILTICNIPRFIAVYTTLLIPAMHIGEAYENMYVFLWALTALFASVNASVNIFVYLTVNSAYRTHFKTLFRCFK